MTTAQQRQQTLADFYTENAASLHRAVARRVDAPAATIEDACQAAWTTLLRRPDIDLDHRDLKWLATVRGWSGGVGGCERRDKPAWRRR